MDHYTRRIIGFGVHVGAVDGVGLCRMFNRATRGDTLPKYLSSDHDRLFEFHRLAGEPAHPRRRRNQDRTLRATLASLRRAADWYDSTRVPDSTLFWTAADLEMKLLEFQRYYNRYRACGIERATTNTDAGRGRCPRERIERVRRR